MPDTAYNLTMSTVEQPRKPLAWLHGEIKTPPFSRSARLEVGMLLGQLQDGDPLGMPHARPMTSIGPRCHELRVRDENQNWRIICRVDSDAIVIIAVFAKTTRQTPNAIITACRRRLKAYEAAVKERREERE
jgi:phage-related protein